MDSAIYNKTYKFALRIINAYKYLTDEQREFILSKQLLRSGTSIGAMCREAEHAQSKADFLNKMNIALKEANETEYWLQLLHDSDYINDTVYKSIIKDCSDILKLLISIVRTTKERI